MSLFMVMDTPLNDPDVVPNSYLSSERAGYPASNVYDRERRRKSWRTAGYWNVESGSNVITFQESAGVNLTATIAVAEYVSTTTFLAAIVTALHAAAGRVGTYTAVQETTTGRIKITQTVAGGATVFRLMWTVTPAFGIILGFDTAADDTGALNYTADLLRIHTSEWLEWDFGIPTNPTALACFGERDIPLQISPTAVIKLQANHTRVWTAPALNLTVTYRENVLALLDPDGLAGAGLGGYRHWRLVIEDKDNPNLYLQLGVVFLGSHVGTSRGCPEFPLEIAPKDYSVVQETTSGQRTTGRGPWTDSFPLNWAGLNIASKELLHGVWQEYGLHSAFIVALDRDNVFSTDGMDQVRLVRFDREPSERLVSPGVFQYAWSLREEL